MIWQRLKTRLLKQADKVQQNLMLLLIGFATCLLGLLMVLMAEYWFGQSLQQEIVALFGLILVGVGVIIAATGYISLSLLRLMKFIQKDRDDHE